MSAERLSHRTVDIVVRKDGDLIPKEIRSRLIINGSETPGTLVFPGVNQDGRIPSRIARLAPESDVASALPYWEVPAEKDAIEALVLAYPRAVTEAWREAHGDEKLAPNVVAESQAAIGAVRLDEDTPEAINSLVLLRPFGLHVEQLGHTPNDRVNALLTRSAATLLQFDQILDPWNLYNGTRIVRRIGPNTRTQLGIGLSKDVSKGLAIRASERHQQGKKTAIMTGERDKLTTPEEMYAAQKKIGITAIDLIILDGATHRSMATKGGARDLHAALKYIHD